jgi:hypothetical protein
MIHTVRRMRYPDVISSVRVVPSGMLITRSMRWCIIVYNCVFYCDIGRYIGVVSVYMQYNCVYYCDTLSRIHSSTVPWFTRAVSDAASMGVVTPASSVGLERGVIPTIPLEA